MSLYYQNVRGLRTKLREVFLNSQKIPADIFALTETNLSPDFLNNEIFTFDFNVFRKDGLVEGNVSSGRGVLIATHNQYDATSFNIPNTELMELVCVKINLNRRCLYLLCFYIRPDQPATVYQNAVDAVDYVFEATNSEDEIIVLGDFNLPHLQWVESDDARYLISSNSVSDKENIITDRMSDSGLHQLSNVKNNLGRQLDLVFSTDVDNCIVTESNHLLATLDCYHPPLSISFCYENGNIITEAEKTYKYDFRKADFGKLNELLSYINFEFIFSNTENIDTILDKFYFNVFNCIAQSVPYVPQKNLSSSPPWYNKELRSLRNLRNKL